MIKNRAARDASPKNVFVFISLKIHRGKISPGNFPYRSETSIFEAKLFSLHSLKGVKLEKLHAILIPGKRHFISVRNTNTNDQYPDILPYDCLHILNQKTHKEIWPDCSATTGNLIIINKKLTPTLTYIGNEKTCEL